MSKFNPLVGKKVVVIGGSTGMGYSTAEGFLSRGSVVLIGSSSAQKVSDAVASLKVSYPENRVEGKSLNLADEASVKEFFDWVDGTEEKGVDHIVFTAADAIALIPIDNLDLTTAESSFTIRVFGLLKCVKHAKPIFNPGGSLSLTIGTVAYKPLPGWSVAAGVNGSVEALCRGLAVDLAPLRVNAICSGVVATSLWDAAFRNNEEAKQAFFKSQADKLLVKAIGEPEDIAQGFLFLAGCKFITGQVVVVDGGGLLA